MKLLGKLSLIDLVSRPMKISLKNIRLSEGLIFSAGDDNRNNSCTVEFNYISKTKFFEIGKEYNFELSSSSELDVDEPKVNDNRVQFGNSYILLRAELCDNEDFVEYQLIGVDDGEQLTLKCKKDLFTYTTGTKLKFYVNVD